MWGRYLTLVIDNEQLSYIFNPDKSNIWLEGSRINLFFSFEQNQVDRTENEECIVQHQNVQSLRNCILRLEQFLNYSNTCFVAITVQWQSKCELDVLQIISN